MKLPDEIERDTQLRLLLTSRLGRSPTRADYDTYFEEQRRAADAVTRKRKEAQAAQEAQDAAVAEAKRITLTARALARSAAKDASEPVHDKAALKQRVQADAARCHNTRLIGTSNDNIEIMLDLDLFDFSGSTLQNITFSSGSTLNQCDFSGSIFENVRFEDGVDLLEADFSGCELKNVIFDPGCNIKGASFRFAKFRRDNSLEVDRNYLATATFDTRRTDEWAKMAQSFAGIWQYINLSLGGLYLMILLGKLYLFGILAERGSSLLKDGLVVGDSAVQISAFEFIFGADFVSVALAALIVIYQGLRLALTMRIGPLIDNEARSGYTPEREDYRILVPAVRFLRTLGLIVFGLFGYEVYTLAYSGPIILPA